MVAAVGIAGDDALRLAELDVFVGPVVGGHVIERGRGRRRVAGQIGAFGGVGEGAGDEDGHLVPIHRQAGLVGAIGIAGDDGILGQGPRFWPRPRSRV